MRGEGGSRVVAERHEGGRCLRGMYQGDTSGLVTVVTPVRNGARHLERAIQSVLVQSYSPIEYIVIDGGSIDGTADILRRHDVDVDYWISEADAGISDGFNKGIRASRGVLIGILAADDWYEPHAVERAMAAYNKQRADIVHGMLRHWDGNRATSTVHADETQLRYDMTINHPTMFVSRQCYGEVGLYATQFRYAMDYEWVLRATLLNQRFVYVPEILANMSRAGASVQHWRSAALEVARAKSMHLPGSRMHRLYCGYQILKGCGRTVLDAVGLSGVVAQFHARCSRVKKTDEPR